ncbi:uncharacterized protein [Aegilops tauschii subsp. strangulata]|uniref:uncharacterized protein n=1 Tax=Aegilops tauschii subsp. strangulata TaxID=200361 RepID=UPI003CC88DCD
MAGPWIIGGDFNMIAYTEDKCNDRINHRMMNRFHRLISDLALRDIYLHGQRYTWSNEQANPTLVKNDGILCTTSWETLYPHSSLRCLASAVPDHCPLLLDCSPQTPTKRRFHFERFWIKLYGFHQLVDEAWNSVAPDADPIRTIYFRLKATTRWLQGWSARTLGHVSTQVMLARELILWFDTAQDSRPLAPPEAWLRCELKRAFLGLTSLERSIARERARFCCLKDGNTSVAFFKIHAAHRSKKNAISCLHVGDATVSDDDAMARAAFDHFTSIIGRAAAREFILNLGALDPHRFDLAELHRPFTEDEIWAVVKSLPLGKAHGPDEFDTSPTLLQHAVSNGILRRLTTRHAASSISLFADDVVLFCHPDPAELRTIHELLDTFGNASGLQTSFAKCSATPIRCPPEMLPDIASTLSCPIKHFPIKYLGLPLSVRKASSSDLMPLLAKLLLKLATWKATLLNRGERLALVRHVLTAMPTHILTTMVVSKPILKKATRIISDFLWQGCKDARTGCCLVSWAKVCHPVELGRLGVRGLHRVGITLRTRWLWLQATDPTRPWRHLHLPYDREVQQIFRASTVWTLGDGETCRFWTDHWLHGQSIAEIAAALAAMVPRRRKRTRLVSDGLRNQGWISDIADAIGPLATLEYVDLWRRLRLVSLSSTPDAFTCSFLVQTADCAPDGQTELFDWWSASALAASSCLRKGFASLVTITAWAIWKHRNGIIFDGLQPSSGELLNTIETEARRWARAGARGLDRILPVT